MASALIQERGTVSGNQMRMSRQNEDATQTFLAGTPLQINPASGALKAWDGITIALGIAGIAKEFGVSLTAAGVPLGTSAPAAGVVPTVGGGFTMPAAQFEPAGSNFLRPAFNDGKTGVVEVIPDTVFYAQVGPLQVVVQTDLGKQYGMTKDADGHWFVDRTKVGANAVCQVTGFDAYDTVRGVLITFLPGIAGLVS